MEDKGTMQGEYINLKQILKRKQFEVSDFPNEKDALEWARKKAKANQEHFGTLGKPPRGTDSKDWRDEE